MVKHLGDASTYVLLQSQDRLLYALRFRGLDEGKGPDIGQSHGHHLQQHSVQGNAVDFRRRIRLEGIELGLGIEAEADLWGTDRSG